MSVSTLVHYFISILKMPGVTSYLLVWGVKGMKPLRYILIYGGVRRKKFG